MAIFNFKARQPINQPSEFTKLIKSTSLRHSLVIVKTMVSSGINYCETYFEFPDFMKLQGEPNSESLYKLRNELKANAQAVYSNLGNGGHGYLALVLSDAQYALLTDQEPFV